MKKGMKIFLIIVGCIVGLLLLISILAGPIVKYYAEKHSVELCHRVVTLEHVRINLFTGGVTIVGLNAKEENGKEDFLSFKKLHVRMSLPRLLGKTVRINRIRLDQLKAQVIQNGIRFNFSDIIDFYTKDRKPKPDKGPSKWSVDIRHIDVLNAAVKYQDVRAGSLFDTKDVNIRVPKLDLDGGPSHLDMTTAFRQGGDFSINGNYNIKKGDFDAHVLMHQLSTDMGRPYLNLLSHLGTVNGLLDGDATLKGCVKEIEKMVFSGTMSLNNVQAHNADQSPLASFKSFAMNIEKADLGQKTFNIKSIELKDPVFNFDIYADGNTFSRLKGDKRPDAASDSTKEARTDTSASPTEIRYNVKKIAITNGSFTYADHAATPEEQVFPVTNFQLTADNLTNGKPSPIKVTANLGSSGKLDCEASLDALNLKNADIVVSIANLDISDFSPYALHYLAYPAEKGILSFTSDVSIKDNWLDSQNALDIYKPTFGDKVKGLKPAAAKIPMKTAMYIITDRKGHVNMELPVKGDISSPEFSFRKIIWKTFTNLLVKIAASPVDMIAKAVGGDKVFKKMTFPAGETPKLSNENTFQLNEIAEVLKEKDQMTLELSAVAGPDGGNSAARACELIRNYLTGKGIPAKQVEILPAKTTENAADVNVSFELKMNE
ncbi:MAG: DUF748 domain-containing protein [Bacteroidales bacterium]|nr:DUF748 domain-containing protein [Bacteroidales bacterium]